MVGCSDQSENSIPLLSGLQLAHFLVIKQTGNYVPAAN